MSENRDFEREVAAWVVAQRDSAPPARALDQILTATSRQRPMPRWLALLKEPPMRLSSRVTVGSPTMRLAAVAAMTSLLILTIAAAAVAAASFLQGPSLDRWALYRGDAERRGEGGQGPVGTLQLRWRFQADSGVHAPTVADGIVYAVSDLGALHALDEQTGAELWNESRVTGHASIVDGVVVVSSVDGTIRALDARSGSERWAAASTLRDVGSGLDVDDTTVYVAMSGAVAALDLSNGTERWRHADPSLGEVHRPALSDGVLYAGTNSGSFVALDAETGELLWQTNFLPDSGTAVATDGVVYIGASSGGGPGRLSAFDAKSGAPLWSIDEGLFTPAVSDGVAYSGSVAGSVTARDALTGDEHWRVQVGAITYPPGVADGILYVPSDSDMRVYGLDATTGAELSRFDLDGHATDGLAIANGSVYVGTSSGSVYAIGGDGIPTESAGLDATATSDTDDPDTGQTTPVNGTHTTSLTLDEPAASPLELTIVSSLPALDLPFFVHMQKELRAEAETLGGITLVETDGEESAPKQSADVAAAVTLAVDGIIVDPVDAVAMAPILQQAVDAGIPVVTVDRGVDGVEGLLSHVGTDNVIGGEAQGRLIIDTYPDGATIVNLQGWPGSNPAIDRSQGLHNVIDPVAEQYPVVAEQTANFSRSDAVGVTEAVLAGLDAPPDVIVAANDDMALGALQVVQEQGLDVAVIGFDASPEALGSVRDGGLLATIEQFPGGQIRGAVQALVGFLRDGVQPEPITLLSPIAITAENIDQGERATELE